MEMNNVSALNDFKSLVSSINHSCQTLLLDVR